MLNLREIFSGYDHTNVIHNINLTVGRNEIVAVVGANGAGKTTLLRTISGLLSCREGRIIFDNIDITNQKPEKVARLGLVHIPEGRQLVPTLSVQDNLLLGNYCKYLVTGAKGRARLYDLVFDLFPILGERRKQMAGTLSGGEQQMLAIARGLMNEPRLLMLDEPTLGLSPKMSEVVCEVLLDLNKNGLPILLVEQNASMALTISVRAYIMNVGRIEREGMSSELRESPDIKEIYLGLSTL